MSRGLRTLIVLVVAIVTAGLATAGVYRLVQGLPVRQAEAPKTSVVVAASALPVGTLLTRDHVRLVAWPAEVPLRDSFSKAEDVVGRGLLVQVTENEPITAPKLAPEAAGGGLPPTIPHGMRALSVRVNEVIGVAGFVVPGTHVDVLVTIGDRQNSVTRTVVTNVQVLTAGSRYDQDKATKDGKPIPATVVTLSLTPEDAERVALASAEGKVMLALRNPLDTTPTETPGVRMATLMGPPAPPPQERTVKGKKVMVAPPPPPAPKPYTVEAIRGAKRTEEVVK